MFYSFLCVSQHRVNSSVENASHKCMNYHFRWLLQPNAFFACLSVMGVHCTSLFCGKIGTEKLMVWFVYMYNSEHGEVKEVSFI